jgi:hypothetical protein
VFQRNILEKIKTHILLPKMFLRKIVSVVEKYCIQLQGMTWLKNCWSEVTDYVTVKGDRFEYFNMMAVKLSVNCHVLISLYQLYSHTCWIAGKHYQSLYSEVLALVADLRIIYWCLSGQLDKLWQGWHGDFTNVYERITWPTQPVSRIWYTSWRECSCRSN